MNWPASLAPARLGELGLLALFIVVYGATLDTGLQPYELHGGDLITHQYAQVQARPSNAPGYPLYTLGGWLWFHGWRTLLAAGDSLPNPAPILSSYSTLWGLLALWLLYRVLCRLTAMQRAGGNWPVAWLLTAFFGVTYFFWYYATTTEQYSSAVAQTIAIIYVYLLWRDNPQRLPLLYLLAFLCGLSFAHMLTTALIIPPLVVVVLWQAPSLVRDPRAVLGSLGAALLPLASYLYVYLRGAQHPEWWGKGDWTSAQDWFWSFVSTAQGREELAWGFEPGRAFFGNGFPEMIWQEMSVLLLISGLAGIWLLGRRLRVLLYGTLILYTIFCWAYRFGNWFQVVLPAYPLLLMGVAPLIDRIQTYLIARLPGRIGRWAALAPLLVLAALTLWRLESSLPRADSRHRAEDTALVRAAGLLAAPLPTGAGLFAAVDDALALEYLIQIWGIRPDLEVVSSAEAAHRLQSAAPLLATWDATPALLDELPPDRELTYQSLGPEWVEVLPTATAVTHTASLAGAIPLDHTLLPGLTLAAYRAEQSPSGAPANHASAPGLDVTLYWKLDQGVWPAGLSISVRPLAAGVQQTGADGHVTQQDRTRPVHGLWPDRSDGSAAVVADSYRLPLPAPLPAGADAFMLLLYEATNDGFRNLAELVLPIPTAP
jgi:hypothetical protein